MALFFTPHFSPLNRGLRHGRRLLPVSQFPCHVRRDAGFNAVGVTWEFGHGNGTNPPKMSAMRVESANTCRDLLISLRQFLCPNSLVTSGFLILRLRPV